MPAPQSAQGNAPDAAWTAAGRAGKGAPGSRPCTLKIKFELGNRMPRITWAIFPAGGKDGVLPAAAVVEGRGTDAGAAGNVICFSTASSAPSSACPAGYF